MRRQIPWIRVVRGGIGVRTLGSHPADAVLLSLGLGGGLTADLEPGTVVVPAVIGNEHGDRWSCDPVWAGALRDAAQRLGLPVAAGALVATERIVTGRARATWAAQGYSAADMESATVAGRAARAVALRVILDTPAHEISPRWRHPAGAFIDPRLWGQGVRLMRSAPRFANRAALVLAETLRGQAVQGDVHAQV
ncbi:MAG: hypothetical protein ACREN2_14020 [Candidatus Dormibacteria bacterium]